MNIAPSALRLCGLLPLALLAGSCGSDSDTTSLSEQSTEVVLSFEALVGSAPATCGVSYFDLGSSAATAELADARLFVSEIELKDSDGQWVALALDESDWQHSGVGLLDFEDGTAGCAESGNSALNSNLSGQLPVGNYTAIRFSVGLPFALNHLDVNTAQPPFNDPSMHWVWRGGYKFLRVDWLVTAGAVPRWNVHLGSTACQSAAPTEAPAEPCGRPNTPRVELSDWDSNSSTIQLDLGALLADSNLSFNQEETPSGCQSNPGEPGDCSAVFSSLGLSFADGTCSNGCADQTVFSKLP